MLRQIVKIYLHLAAASGEGQFATSVARDGRSFSEKIFLEARAIVDRHALLSIPEVDAFDLFIEKLQSQVAADAQEDEMLGDIPDEFLDPIQFTLMQDPVLLP